MRGFLKHKGLSSKGRGGVFENTVSFCKSENNSDEVKRCGKALTKWVADRGIKMEWTPKSIRKRKTKPNCTGQRLSISYMNREYC